MVKRYTGGVISATVPTVNASTASGIYAASQAMQYKQSSNWPTPADLTISPSFNGKSSWNFNADGPLNITSGSYTITALRSMTTTAKLWGQGGWGGKSGGGNSYQSGAGGALVGTITMSINTSYYLTFFGSGSSPATVNSNGGNAAGIFLGSSAIQGNAIAIAGGGGGGGYDDGGRGGIGGAGGHPSGADGSGYTNAGGKGGTQSAGGAAGTASNLGTAGSALQGGSGGNSNVNYGGGGGGGGYYGGGGGSIQASWAGGGGGGGSNYANTSLITSVTQYSGSGTTPGNSADSDRNGAGSGVAAGSTAGSAGGSGRILITFVS